MMSSTTTLERAFDLARTGDYANLNQITKQLRAEGYDLKQIEGQSLRRQLRALCDDSRGPEP